MCGRYYILTLSTDLADHFSVPDVPSFEPNYNVAPTTQMPIVVQKGDDRRCGLARWGLIPSWAKDAKIGSKMINARSETAATKPAFRSAWKRRRCIVPLSGFYEWRTEDGGKQPYSIHPSDRSIMGFGGLWERWRPPKEGADDIISFSILTCEAEGKIADIHHRMPVLIRPENTTQWLTEDPDELPQSLQSLADLRLDVYPVSRSVNSVRNNGPELLNRIA